MIYSVSAVESRPLLPGHASRRSLTKADAAYAEIRERILSCELAPGSVIEQESLAAWLGSSTTPVRESLRRLAAEQLVILPAHSDARIASVSLEEFQELHTVRLGLETLAASIAATKLTAADVSRLRDLLAAPEGVSDPVSDDRSGALHRAIYAASLNRTIIQILDSTWDRIGRYRVLLARAGAVPSCRTREHEVIIDALERHDSDGASRLVQQHLDDTFRVILPAAADALQPYA